jgi:hypothetical protein
LSIFYFLVIAVSLFVIAENGFLNSVVFAQEQMNTNVDYSLITSITDNLLTVVSFLTGTSSFILGLRIQNLSKSAPNPVINKYFSILILALIVPSVIITAYGIFVIGSSIEPGDMDYLLLLFSLFVPAGVILFLVGKMGLTSKTNC